jgi:anthranilate synthase component 2
VEVIRNDKMSVAETEAFKPEFLVVSPGPCTPNEAGISKQVIERFGPRIPVLGVCLGHQCIGETYHGRVLPAQRLMHGKVSNIHHDGRGLFAGLKNPFSATRYHSLAIPLDCVPAELELCAWTADEDFPREVMGVRHRRFPVHGVQFHPESFLTDGGIDLLRNFLDQRTDEC